MTAAMGAYFFLLALVLAHLEIEIEGPHGWAEKLPTRRWDGPRVRRWLGRPVTGYHFCLAALLLLFLHLPQFYRGTWEREADLLAMFLLLSVTWDFLWFACNPHFGVARFRKGEVWWLPAWTLGVPRPYLVGIALSAAVALTPALWMGGWSDRVRSWGLVLGELAALTLVVILVTRVPRRGEAALRAVEKVNPD